MKRGRYAQKHYCSDCGTPLPRYRASARCARCAARDERITTAVILHVAHEEVPISFDDNRWAPPPTRVLMHDGRWFDGRPHELSAAQKAMLEGR